MAPDTNFGRDFRLRLVSQEASSRLDTAHGVVEIVAGTGGKGHAGFGGTAIYYGSIVGNRQAKGWKTPEGALCRVRAPLLCLSRFGDGPYQSRKGAPHEAGIRASSFGVFAS